jgi:hypothetical protein
MVDLVIIDVCSQRAGCEKYRFARPWPMAIRSASSPIAGFDLQAEEGADSDGHYAGEVTAPGTDFRVAVVGRDANGFPFQRVDGRLFLAR